MTPSGTTEDILKDMATRYRTCMSFMRVVHYNAETDIACVTRVMNALKSLKIPLPQNENQFMEGTDGALLFLNAEAVVIRIENKETAMLYDAVRLDDHPLVLQPLAKLDAGAMVIEICAGTKLTGRYADALSIGRALEADGLWFIDQQSENTGLLPVRTPDFPRGVPVVIDRLAVARLDEEISAEKKTLSRQAKEAQKKLYKPLRTAFRRAHDKGRMRDFWMACRVAKIEGVLIDGWNSDVDRDVKARRVPVIAAAYEKMRARRPK